MLATAQRGVRNEPPSDAEAEKKTVGALLVEPSLVDELIGKLRPEDFAFDHYRAMYAGIIDLVVEGQPLSVATLSRKTKTAQAEVVACLEGADAGEVEFWAARITKTQKLRALLAAGEKAQELALADSDPDTAFGTVSAMLTAVEDGQDSATIGMVEGSSLVMERINRYIDNPGALAGLATGWDKLDRILDGLRPGGVTAVYAKTSAFKSMFVGNIGWRLAREGIPGMWFTTESPTLEVMERLAQFESGLNFRELRYQHDLWRHRDAIHGAVTDLEEFPIWVCDRSVLDIGFVAGAVSRLNRQRNLKYVIIDLVDHVSSKFLSRSETESEKHIAQQVKEMAKREELHVILTTHIKKPDRFLVQAARPYIEYEEVRGSGAKIGDADAAISLMVVKQDTYGYAPMDWKEISEERRTQGWHRIYAAVMKNRHGPTEHVLFRVDLAEGCRMTAEADQSA